MATRGRRARTAAGAGGSTPGSPDRRQAILDAAVRLFARYGYRRTAMEEVAREAGVAKGTTYLYFDTKEALFRALSQAALARVLDAARRAAAGEGPLADRLVDLLDAKFGFFHEVVHRSPHAGELVDSKNRLSADLFATADAAYRRLLQRAVTTAVARRELDPRRFGIAPAAVAQVLLHGAYGVEASAGPDVDARAFRARLAALVQVLLAGLGGTGGGGQSRRIGSRSSQPAAASAMRAKKRRSAPLASDSATTLPGGPSPAK